MGDFDSVPGNGSLPTQTSLTAETSTEICRCAWKIDIVDKIEKEKKLRD